MSPTQALIWKEWRQLQWRWIFSLAVCGIFVIVGLKTRVMPDEGIVAINFCGCAFLLPLFIGMGLISEEREEGSLRMQLALPVTARQVYVVKMMLAILTVTLTTIISLVIALIMAANREKTSVDIVLIYGFTIPFGIIFVLWTIVFSIKRKTQWASALTGMVILAVWVFLIMGEDMFIQKIVRDHWNFSLILTPFGFLEAGLDKGPWLATSVVQGILSVCLFLWGMRRFSVLTRSGK